MSHFPPSLNCLLCIHEINKKKMKIKNLKYKKSKTNLLPSLSETDMNSNYINLKA